MRFSIWFRKESSNRVTLISKPSIKQTLKQCSHAAVLRFNCFSKLKNKQRKEAFDKASFLFGGWEEFYFKRLFLFVLKIVVIHVLDQIAVIVNHIDIHFQIVFSAFQFQFVIRHK